MKLPGGLVFALLVATTELSAQVKGIVRDSTGRPLEGAVVDLWAGPTRTGRIVTTASGRFEFRDAIRDGRLTVRRIGSRAAVRSVVAGDSMLTVVLHPGLIAVDAIEVRGGSCAPHDEREARSAWIAAAQHYRPLPDSLWLSSEFKLVQERVSADLVGRPNVDSTGFGWTGGGASAFWMRTWQARIARVGYLAPDPESHSFESTFWAGHHQRWVSTEFGQESRFSSAPEGTIRFCTKKQDLPWVEGELRIGEDGGIVWVRWRFRSKAVLPATGGEALFLAPARDSSMPLLPSSETIWQERPHGMAAQMSAEYREWRLTLEKPHWP